MFWRGKRDRVIERKRGADSHQNQIQWNIKNYSVPGVSNWNDGAGKDASARQL